AVQHAAVLEQDAHEGGEVVRAPAALHVGFARADGAAERDLAVEARVVHAHSRVECAARSPLAEAFGPVAVDERERAVLDAGATGAHGAARQPVQEMRLGRGPRLPGHRNACRFHVFLACGSAAASGDRAASSFAGWVWTGTPFSHSLSASQ